MITRTLMLLVLAFSALTGFALEVGDLHLPLKRSEADNTLTKDYTYNVLSDGTIRRTWHISQRTVSVDFDPVSDDAICIIIDYTSPVPRKTAEEDAAALAPSANSKWKKAKASAVTKVGIPAESFVRGCGGKSIMFMEGSRTKKKYSAISFFAKGPTEDRRALKPVSGEVRTAMGTTSASGNIKALISDEARRQSTAPAAATAPKVGSPTPLASTPKQANGKHNKPNVAKNPVASKPAKPSKPVAVATKNPDGQKVEKVVVTRVVTVEESETPDTLAGRLFSAFASDDDADEEEYDNVFDMLKAKATPFTMTVAGIAAFLLLMLVVGAIARIRTKRRQKAVFEELVSSAPANPSSKIVVPKKDS